MIDRYRHYTPNQKHLIKKKKTRRRKIIITIAAITSALLLISIILNRRQETPISKPRPETAKTEKSSEVIEVESSNLEWGNLEKELNELLNLYSYLNISTSVSDIENNVIKTFGSTEPIHGASTTKLITAAAFLNLVENGKASLDQLIEEDTARGHLQLMVNMSDNDSWEILNNFVGKNNLNEYAKSINMKDFQVTENTITSRDMSLFLSKLFKRKILNSANTDLLLSWMQNTNNEMMIPMGASSGTIINHKYGLYDGGLHDVGILQHEGIAIAVSIYTHQPSTTLPEGQMSQDQIQAIREITTTILQNIDSN